VLPSVQRTTHDTCQRVKRRICDQEVVGSIPGRGDAVQRLWAS